MVAGQASLSACAVRISTLKALDTMLKLLECKYTTLKQEFQIYFNLFLKLYSLILILLHFSNGFLDNYMYVIDNFGHLVAEP